MKSWKFHSTGRKGFALVVTLSLMILLSLLAVGLLSLSVVSLRSSSQEIAQAEARANARLGLMIAIGELQKHMGPDRRISARAEILDANPGTEETDGVSNPHYLGVWDSWDSWLTDKKGTLSIKDTYKPGRDPSLFRSWLVSHPDSGKYETAIDSTPATDWVELCGKNTAGPDVANHVKARRIPLRGGGKLDGNYAWWVSDESLKARIDLKPRDDASTIASAQILASHTGRTGIEKMTAMSGFDTRPESLAKMITTGQAGIGDGGAGVSEHFHDLTAYSLGLLTDVRSGGFKSDINLAFESNVVPEGMGVAQLFGNRPFDAPIRPMTGELAKITPQNPYVAPMSWRQMREYYRVYREFPEDGGKKHPIRWTGSTPETPRYVTQKASMHLDVMGYQREPVLLRLNWVLATHSKTNPSMPGGVEYQILAIPVIHLWNPYNVAMRIKSKEISYLGSMFASISMWHKVYRGSNKIEEGIFPSSNINGANLNTTIFQSQSGYNMVISENPATKDVVFEPGQVRVFSTDVEATNQAGGGQNNVNIRSFIATPGFKPVNDVAGVRGLKYIVNPGSGSQSMNAELTCSLRLYEYDLNNFTNYNNSYFFGASRKAGIVLHNHQVDTSSQGLYDLNGNDPDNRFLSGGEDYHRVARMGVTSVDWLTSPETFVSWIVRDDIANRARWGQPGSNPVPIGIYSITAKCAERLEYDDDTRGFAKDYRNRTWLHAPHSRSGHILMNPTDLNRADFPYQIHFRPVNGDNELSQYLQADGDSGFFGSGYTGSAQTHISSHSLPSGPTTNLASFAGIRVDHASCGNTQSGAFQHLKHLAHAGGAFGLGIGNAYAHPMIEADKVYTRNGFGVDNGWDGLNKTGLPVTDDYWDHLFLSNEELWDSWFCSGIAPVMNNGSVVTPKNDVATDFFSNMPTQMSPHIQPYLRDKTVQELAKLVETTSAATGGNGWDRIASHILNKGQFNLNSTSKEAWKALLMSLTDRPIAYYDPKSGTSVISPDEDEVTLSRHPLANGASAAEGPGDDNAWRGIRKLTEPQIDKLAGEIVRQVKLRGPFLNMAEFINRRLTTEDTGVTGTLQAAIDWDEFNAGYNGSTSGTGKSINKAYKGSDDMISSLPASYPNPKAAKGSRYAGIPGYVMQSDILQGISSSLSVRGDTFVIRAYGESLADGKIAARAWCEAVVQRMPEYVDPSDAADKKMRIAGKLPGETAALQPANQNHGRQFKITSFRWLNKDEI